MLKVLFVLTVVAALTLGKPDDHYTTKYDKVNLDNILNNDRLLDAYVKCLLDEGPCAPDAKELKDVLPEALRNECAKCSAQQKEAAKKVLRFLFEKKHAIYKKLEAKYDPEEIHRKQYREQAAKEGYKI